MSTPPDALALLRGRCAQVPAALVALLRQPPAWPPLPAGVLLTTGVGGSEGPARLLASRLLRQGRPARFVPLSAFLEAPPPASALILFSQGLSPNARLVLAHTARYPTALLLTGLPADHADLLPFVARGLRVVSLPSGDERGLLVRVIGPAVASLAALLLAGASDPRSIEFPDMTALTAALSRASERGASLPPLPPGPLGLLAVGERMESYEGLRWRLLEGMLRPHVSLWDALAVAHGPFQSFHRERLSLVGFAGPGALGDALLDRLQAMLVPERHTLWRLPAVLPEPWSLFEHMVQLDALMCASLAAHPQPLAPWPGQGDDGPLYLLGQQGLEPG